MKMNKEDQRFEHFFHIIPVELLEKRQVSYAEHCGNKDCVSFVSTLYFLEI